jgi:hypothetical protein
MVAGMISGGELDVTRRWFEDDWPHRCSALRRSVIDTSPYNEPIYSDYAEHLYDVPCLFWSESISTAHGEQLQANNRATIDYQFMLKVPFATDIGEDDVIDRVVNVKDESLNQTALRIEAVIVRSTHKVLRLLEVRSA